MAVLENISNLQWGGVGAAFPEAHDRQARFNRALRSAVRVLFRGAFFLGLSAASHTLAPWAQAQGPSEYQVKAVFLLNFAKFVEWPNNSPGDAHDPASLCIVGDDPFGAILNQTVRGKAVNGHELAVKRFKRGEDARGCQIVFISSSETKRLHGILESLKGTSVLTVGETEGFAQRGGIINFVLEDNRVHFEVNVEAAERAGLRISSKLLSLAKIVKDEGHGG